MFATNDESDRAEPQRMASSGEVREKENKDMYSVEGKELRNGEEIVRKIRRTREVKIQANNGVICTRKIKTSTASTGLPFAVNEIIFFPT